MLFKKSSKEKESGKDDFSPLSVEAKGEGLPSLLIRLISRIRNHGEEFLFLEAVAREGLNLLQAHRSTIYILDEEKQIFKAECSLACDATYKAMGQAEEAELARKMIPLSKPVLVKSIGDLSKILQSESIKVPMTSLTSAPFFSNGKPMGAILATRFEKKPPFNEFDHQVTSLLADLISLKMEDQFLHKELEKADQLRKTYERYLDDLLAKLQTHFPAATPMAEQQEDLPTETPPPPSKPEGEDGGVEAVITLPESDPRNRRQDERIQTIVRVEFEDHDLGLTENLSCGGAFVRTITPLELGVEFSMLLHLGDGGRPLDLNCKVVWTNQYGSVTRDLQRGMGIKFQNLSEEGRTRLEKYLEQQKARQPAP